MPLSPCPECGHQVSDKATVCPKCGHKLQWYVASLFKRYPCLYDVLWAVGLLVVFGIAALLITLAQIMR